MNLENSKCVMVIDGDLPLGIMANIAAILGSALGNAVPEIIGKPVADKNGILHSGIIEIPVPVLKGNTSLIRQIRSRAQAEPEGIKLIDFSTLAQKCKTYEEYIEKMKDTDEESLDYMGILLLGDKKLLNRLTGSLPLLR